jgi:hypothetical protein
MKQELDNQLCEKYPKIFADRHKPMTETCMCWGFECGDGWYNILDQLCNNIQHYIDWKNRKEEIVPQVVAEQVKEKFGTLRFYYRGGDDYIEGMVRMADSMSSILCEECGDTGKQRYGGWIRTLCDEHYNQKDRS